MDSVTRFSTITYVLLVKKPLPGPFGTGKNGLAKIFRFRDDIRWLPWHRVREVVDYADTL